MKADQSAELSILLLACTIDPSAERRARLTTLLTQPHLNWDRLYALATRHRLTPFLYRTFQQFEGVPEPFLSTLRDDCRLAATDNMLKLREYHQVAALLAAHSIDHIAYKGVHLAETSYPDTGLRICGDIDILVDVDAVTDTIQLLQAQQYQLNKKHTRYWEHSNRSILTDLYEVSLFKPFFSNYFDIDLHWEIVCFNRHYQSFRLGDFVLPTDHPLERQIILLVTHHGVTNIWQHVYYVNDLYFLVNGKLIDWPWLLQELRQYGLERVCLVGFHWCRQIWALALPSAVETLLTDRYIPSLAIGYEKNWETNQPNELSNLVLKQLTYFSNAQTRFDKRAKIYLTFFTSRVFRASTFSIGKRLLYIPKELGFVTVFIRAVRSFSRFLPTRQ